MQEGGTESVIRRLTSVKGGSTYSAKEERRGDYIKK